MSNTTGSSADGPADDERGPGARTASDPWPHEHGEHPSGVSVPEGYGRPAVHEHRAHLLGEPQVVDGDRRRGVRTIVWLVVAALLAAAVVALLLNPPW